MSPYPDSCLHIASDEDELTAMESILDDEEIDLKVRYERVKELLQYSERQVKTLMRINDQLREELRRGR